MLARILKNNLFFSIVLLVYLELKFDFLELLAPYPCTINHHQPVIPVLMMGTWKLK